VLKWPNPQTVIRALKNWAEKICQSRPDIIRLGYFGSYARGDWGVGSDLDLIIILEKSDQSFERRAAEFDTLALPVPTDVVVYTREEWQALAPRKFFQTLEQEAIWVYPQKL
jgi:predicted nucleotidyltransferase